MHSPAGPRSDGKSDAPLPPGAKASDKPLPKNAASALIDKGKKAGFDSAGARQPLATN